MPHEIVEYITNNYNHSDEKNNYSAVLITPGNIPNLFLLIEVYSN